MRLRKKNIRNHSESRLDCGNALRCNSFPPGTRNKSPCLITLWVQSGLVNFEGAFWGWFSLHFSTLSTRHWGFSLMMEDRKTIANGFSCLCHAWAAQGQREMENIVAPLGKKSMQVKGDKLGDMLVKQAGRSWKTKRPHRV